MNMTYKDSGLVIRLTHDTDRIFFVPHLGDDWKNFDSAATTAISAHKFYMRSSAEKAIESLQLRRKPRWIKIEIVSFDLTVTVDG